MKKWKPNPKRGASMVMRIMPTLDVVVKNRDSGTCISEYIFAWSGGVSRTIGVTVPAKIITYYDETEGLD